MQIGFFDSGIGGITVLYQALKILPKENFLYYADTLHVPYGEKSMDEVKRYIFEASDFIANLNVKALVIACNTATSAAIEELRTKYPFPIIGIEPAVKPAITKSKEIGKRVLVLATKLTLKEEKFKNLVTRLDDNNVVDGLPLPGLVEFAEKFQFDDKTVLPYLNEKLGCYDWDQYGTIVLGCTHFPFFKGPLRKIIPEHIEIIDGSSGTARNLKRILDKNRTINEGTGEIEYYKSGIKIEDNKIIEQYSRLLKLLDEI